MPDQESTPPPAPPGPGPGPSAKPTSTGLPSNVAAAIACVPLIGGIIFYILEKRDSFVRFYAMQSIIFGFAWILISIACAIVAGVFSDQGPLASGFFRGFWYLVTRLIDLALFVVF